MEPLKNKECNIIVQKVQAGEPLNTEISTEKGFFKTDISKAVEWLKKEIRILEDDGIISFMDSEEILKKVKLAFEDVTKKEENK